MLGSSLSTRLAGALIGLLAFALHQSAGLVWVERLFHDTWVVLAAELASDAREEDDVLVIGVDEDAIRGGPEDAGRMRTLVTQLLDAIRPHAPASVAVDVMMTDPGRTPEQDVALERAIAAYPRGKIVLAFRYLKEAGGTVAQLPLARFRDAGASWGFVDVPEEDDLVLRRLQLARQNRTGAPDQHLALAAARAARGWPETALTRHAWEARGGDGTLHYRIRTVPGEAVSLAPYRGLPGRIASLAASEVLKIARDPAGKGGDLLATMVKGKVVFIGATYRDSGDHHRTPFWWWPRVAQGEASVLTRDVRTLGGRTYGVEVAAMASRAILDSGREGALASAFPATVEPALQATLLAGAGALMEAGASALSGGAWLAAVAGLLACAVLGSFALFALTGLLVPAAPYVTLVVLIAVARMRMLAERESARKEQLKRTLSRYVSREISEAILDRPHLLRLPGRKVEVSVLFCDLRGFTTLSESLEPADLMQLMNDFLQEMTEAVLENGGVVNKFLGDGLMAFWGAPLPVPDHADRACAAGRAMLARLARLNERLAARGRGPLAMGVGINSGPAVVGTVGYEERLEYTLVGDTVNVASRIQDLTKQYGRPILIGEGTAARVSAATPHREVDRVQVRGRQELTVIHEAFPVAGEPARG